MWHQSSGYVLRPWQRQSFYLCNNYSPEFDKVMSVGLGSAVYAWPAYNVTSVEDV